MASTMLYAPGISTGPFRVREAKGLFGAQRPFILVRVELHISAGALVAEPLANNTCSFRARFFCARFDDEVGPLASSLCKAE